MEIRKGAVARKRCTAPFLYKKLQLNFISIHTPARGVTLQERVKHRQHIYISIHTPTRGVTYPCCTHQCLWWFQSTLPHGEWRSFALVCVLALGISIHTPTRGVTAYSFPLRLLPEESFGSSMCKNCTYWIFVNGYVWKTTISNGFTTAWTVL